jgi:prephenate dehydratase
MAGPRGVRIGFLGPEGTFTHETAESAAAALGWPEPHYVPYPSGLAAVQALARGEVDHAVVAVATKLGGERTEEARAIAELGLKVLTAIQRVCHYHLLGLPGAALGGVRVVRSNPKALADCRARLAALVPGAALEHTASTAAAVQSVATAGRPEVAAVGTAAAARRYGLLPLAENIEDDPDNWTRWLVLTRSVTG